MMFMSVTELCKHFHICMKTTSANVNKKFRLILNSESIDWCKLFPTTNPTVKHVKISFPFFLSWLWGLNTVYAEG